MLNALRRLFSSYAIIGTAAYTYQANFPHLSFREALERSLLVWIIHEGGR